MAGGLRGGLQALDRTPKLPYLSCSPKAQPCSGAPVIAVWVACYHQILLLYKHVCDVWGLGWEGWCLCKPSGGGGTMAHRRKTALQGAFLPHETFSPHFPNRVIRSSRQPCSLSRNQDLHSSLGPCCLFLLLTRGSDMHICWSFTFLKGHRVPD